MSDLYPILIFWLATILRHSLVLSQFFSPDNVAWMDLETETQGNNTEICPLMMKLVYGDIRYHCKCKVNADDTSHPSPCYTQNKMKRSTLETIASQLINKTSRFNQDDFQPRMSSSSSASSDCGNCVTPPKCCDTTTQVLFPLYGYSLLSQSMARIVQETEANITQPVLFRQCLTRRSNVIRGFCRQSYLPRLMYVYTNTSGRGYPYTQDVILMPSTCDCFINMDASSWLNHSSNPVTDTSGLTSEFFSSNGTLRSESSSSEQNFAATATTQPTFIRDGRTIARSLTSIEAEMIHSTAQTDDKSNGNRSKSWKSIPNWKTSTSASRMVGHQETGPKSDWSDSFLLSDRNGTIAIDGDDPVDNLNQVDPSRNRTVAVDLLHKRNVTSESSASKWESKLSYHLTRKEISSQKGSRTDEISLHEVMGLQKQRLKDLLSDSDMLANGNISGQPTDTGMDNSTRAIWSLDQPALSSPTSQQMVPVESEMTSATWDDLPETDPVVTEEPEEGVETYPVPDLNRTVGVSDMVKKRDDDKEAEAHSATMSRTTTPFNDDTYRPITDGESSRPTVTNKEEMAISSERVAEKYSEISGHVYSTRDGRKRVEGGNLKPVEEFKRRIGFTPSVHQSFTATSL